MFYSPIPWVGKWQAWHGVFWFELPAFCSTFCWAIDLNLMDFPIRTSCSGTFSFWMCPSTGRVSQGGVDPRGGPLLDRLVVPGEKGTGEPSPGALGDCRSPLSCTCYSLITSQWLWRAVTLRLLGHWEYGRQAYFDLVFLPEGVELGLSGFLLSHSYQKPLVDTKSPLAPCPACLCPPFSSPFPFKNQGFFLRKPLHCNTFNGNPSVSPSNMGWRLRRLLQTLTLTLAWTRVLAPYGSTP